MKKEHGDHVPKTFTPSIDSGGFWSETQVKWVLGIINPEARKHGMFYQAIEVTTHNDTGRRFLLQLNCLEHGEPIVSKATNACFQCLQKI